MSRLAIRGLLLSGALLLGAWGSHAIGVSRSPAAARDLVGARAGGLSVPPGDWTRFNFDAQRSGSGPVDTGIAARDVHLLSRRTVRIDGTVDSAAIELHAIKIHARTRDVVVVTTTYGRTIALDASTGARLWEFVPSNIRGYEGSFQITTATPIADPSRRYVFAASPDGMIHKLQLTTGSEVRGSHWPARVTFDARHEKLASALNISGRRVIAVTGGYVGDAPSYQGHVVEIDRTSGRISQVWNSLCSNRHSLINPPRSCPASDSAIWARAGAVIEPGSGRILLATGNGPFNGATNWGDSVLELTPDAHRLLDNWTPVNEAQLNAGDADVGSTTPALLPELGGRRLAVQGGKDGKLALLDLNSLNGSKLGAGHRLGGELQEIQAPGSSAVLTAPAVWMQAGRSYVFVANDSGTAAYVVGRDQRLSVSWRDTTPGTSPVVAGGLLYVYDERDGAVVIRSPTSERVLKSLPLGKGHWNSPIVVGGRIILPEGNANDHARSGLLDIYHLPGR